MEEKIVELPLTQRLAPVLRNPPLRVAREERADAAHHREQRSDILWGKRGMRNAHLFERQRAREGGGEGDSL